MTLINFVSLHDPTKVVSHRHCIIKLLVQKLLLLLCLIRLSKSTHLCCILEKLKFFFLILNFLNVSSDMCVRREHDSVKICDEE